MKASLRSIAAALAVALFAPVAARAQSSAATAMDGDWHLKVAPYVWGAGLKGSVGVNGVVSVPVDLSFGDALEKLDFVFQGLVEGRKDKVGFALDIAYLNLGAGVSGPVTGRIGLGADVRTVTLEGVLTYRVVNDDARGGFVDVLFGGRYMGNNATLAVTRNGEEIPGTKRSFNWVDGLAGARFRLPLGTKAGLTGRADIAGFGSDFTWNLVGGLDVALGATWKLEGGYRYLDVDYDKGSGLDRRIWQVTYKGPYVAVVKSW